MITPMVRLEYFYLFADGVWKSAARGPQYFGLSDGSPFSDLRPLPQEISDPEDY